MRRLLPAPSTRVVVGVASLLALGVGVLVVDGQEYSPAARDARHAATAKLRLARRIARTRRVATGPGLTPRRARRLAHRRERSIPLPDGGNFHGVKWENAGAFIERSQLEQVLQYNAWCQWRRARSERREPAAALRILAVSARWPAFRGQPASTGASALAGCYASHRREVQHARSRGQTPSS